MAATLRFAPTTFVIWTEKFQTCVSGIFQFIGLLKGPKVHLKSAFTYGNYSWICSNLEIQAISGSTSGPLRTCLTPLVCSVVRLVFLLHLSKKLWRFQRSKISDRRPDKSHKFQLKNPKKKKWRIVYNEEKSSKYTLP